MKKHIGLIILLISSFVNADNCFDDKKKGDKLKRIAVKAMVNIDTNYDSNADLLLKQFQQLTDQLASMRELVDLSENSLKYCTRRYIKEIYDLSNKQRAFYETIDLSTKHGKNFQDRYIVPNDTWTDVAKAIEEDILKKRAEVKARTKSVAQKNIDEESERKGTLETELKEVQELQELVNKKNKLEADNQKLVKAIEQTKQKESSKAVKKQQVRKNNNTYTEGKTKFYVKKANLFCLSKKQFDYQIDLLTQGIMKYATNCYETAFDVDVIMLDYGMLGRTKVKAVSDGTVMWVTTESIGKR